MTITAFLQKVDVVILNPLILLAFAVAFLYFVYGIVKYVSLDVADAGRKEAQNAIVWGVAGMVIMFSVYGVISFVLDTFGISKGDVKYINGSL